MAVYVPSGQTTQLVGLPPLPDSFYEKLPALVAEVYAEYQEMARELEFEKKHGKDTNRLSKES